MNKSPNHSYQKNVQVSVLLTFHIYKCCILHAHSDIIAERWLWTMIYLTKVESTLPTKVSTPPISWSDKRPQRNKKEQVHSTCGSEMEWQTSSYVYLWGCTCNRINLTNNSGQTTLLFKSLFTIISFLQGMHLEITYKSSVVIANSKKVKKLIKEVTPGMNPNRPSCQIIDC